MKYQKEHNGEIYESEDKIHWDKVEPSPNAEETNHTQHPKVIACQGEGETMVKSLDFPTTDDGVGTSSQNPSAETYTKQETNK